MPACMHVYLSRPMGGIADRQQVRCLFVRKVRLETATQVEANK